MLSHVPEHFVLAWKSPHLATLETPQDPAPNDDAAELQGLDNTDADANLLRRPGCRGGGVSSAPESQSAMDAYLDSDFFPLFSIDSDMLHLQGESTATRTWESTSRASKDHASATSSMLSSPERDVVGRMSEQYQTTWRSDPDSAMADTASSLSEMNQAESNHRRKTRGSFGQTKMANAIPPPGLMRSKSSTTSTSSSAASSSPTRATKAPLGRGEKAAQRCHTCRARRLVCDQTLPACEKCASRGVECPGYGQNLRWVQPEQKTTKSAAAKASTRGLGRKARGRPRLQLMDVKDEDGQADGLKETWEIPEGEQHQPGRGHHGSEADETGVRESRRWTEGVLAIQSYHLKKALLPEDYHRNSFTLEHLRYHNNHMISDLGVVQSTASVHIIPLQVWRYIPSYLINYLIATGTTHQIIRAQSPASVVAARRQNRNTRDGNIYRRLQSFGHPRMRLVLENFQKAIGNVNAIIAESPDLVFRKVKGLDGGDLMFAAISGLMLAEAQQTAFTSWAVHFQALRVMLYKRGGFDTLASAAQPRTLYLLNTYLIVDTVRRFTSSGRTLALTPDDTHEYVPHLPHIYADGLETGTPCPTDCFAYAVRVNQVRRRWALARDPTLDPSQPPEDLETLRADATAALRQVREFDPVVWAHTRKPDYEQMLLRRADVLGNRADVERELEAGPDMEAWIEFAVVFQLANMVYGLRTTVVDQTAPDWPASPSFASGLGLLPHESALTLLSTAFESLLSVLRRMHQCAKAAPTTSRFFGLSSSSLSSSSSSSHSSTACPSLAAAGGQGNAERETASEWPWRFTFWPLFVACMESTCSGEGKEERGWMLEAIFAIGLRQTDFCTLDGGDFFEMVWEADEQLGKGGARRTWDEVLGDIDGKGLFFV